MIFPLELPGIVARWQGWEGDGLEHLVLGAEEDLVRAYSIVIGKADDQPFLAQYFVRCDRKWRTSSIELGLLPYGQAVALGSDGQGNWRDHNGKLPALEGAIDVDITCTPFTNTLPIRRLGLEAGQSADITVAYIDVPSLNVTADPQRYTCLEPMRRYRFESLDSDFVREIEVDEHGLVTLYPGQFRRVL
jgi:uncharacterized protein